MSLGEVFGDFIVQVKRFNKYINFSTKLEIRETRDLQLRTYLLQNRLCCDSWSNCLFPCSVGTGYAHFAEILESQKLNTIVIICNTVRRGKPHRA